MQLKPFFLFCLMIGTITDQAAAAVNDPILKAIQPGTFTIIGETHHQRESIRLFQSLVTNYLQQNRCLTVALEIASNQQPVIDRVAQNRATASDIKIPSMIDHPPFRKMIDDLAALKHKGACLKLLAIDAGDNIDTNRDAWMALKLADHVGNTPILMLLGGLHTMKKVDWDLSMTHPSPSVSEIISKQGFRVNTYPQAWATEKCAAQKGFRNRFIQAKTSEALTLLNDSLISLINAFDFKTTKGVIDGFVLWECRI